MGDNGDVKKEEVKTDIQLANERHERYTKNPETFIEISELICAVMRNPKSQLGISVMIGYAQRSELNQGQAELNHLIDLLRRQMDIESQAKHQSKHVITPGSMMDFARRKMGRK